MSEIYDLVVSGAGPGGEVGAIRAAQLGMNVALVEKNEHLWGTCLNVGCIPTKSLIESAKVWTKFTHAKELGFKIGSLDYDLPTIMGRKDKVVGEQRKGLLFLMKKNKIELHRGHGRFVNASTVEVTGESGKKTLKTKHTLIATCSRVKELPFVKSNGRSIHTSDTILFIDRVPKSLAVIGGGVVGMEFASLFGRFGCNVTVIEMLPQVIPFEDPESASELVKHLRKQNVSVETNAKLTKIEDKETTCVVHVD